MLKVPSRPMSSRAMVVVGGGSSTRFGSDKLMIEIAGQPLIVHTIDAVVGQVDTCVVVCRAEIVDTVSELRPDVIVAVGGATRTASEISGLAALDSEHRLIGIHDAARPMVSASTIDQLFHVAEQSGGAVPLLPVERLVVDRETHEPISDLWTAQTPQVLRGPELIAAYEKAASAGFEGHDTLAVVERFSDLTVMAVAGDPENVKITYPSDLEKIRARLTGPSRT